MTLKNIALGFVFCWFLIGGIGHFAAPDVFLKIVPPSLPLRLQSVYISGFFELLGAAGLLLPRMRRLAGIGLFVLTLVVTPANVYMWMNPQLFPQIPPALLLGRLFLQVILLGLILWSTRGAPRERKLFSK